MVDSHESDAFGHYFEKVHFLNIQNKQRLYITTLNTLVVPMYDIGKVTFWKIISFF